MLVPKQHDLLAQLIQFVVEDVQLLRAEGGPPLDPRDDGPPERRLPEQPHAGHGNGDDGDEQCENTFHGTSPCSAAERPIRGASGSEGARRDKEKAAPTDRSGLISSRP